MYSCQRCGKSTQILKTGAHKHGGAWAMRAPKTRKVMRPNLQRVKTILDNKIGRFWLCTRCLKTLKKEPNIKKAVGAIPQTPIFQAAI